MTTASIDLGEMADVLAAMENAAEQIPSRRGSLRGHLVDVWLSTTPLNRMDEVAEWVDEQLPGVRRRLVLAPAHRGADPRPAADSLGGPTSSP